MINKDEILSALGKVIEPELAQDLVSLKMVKDLEVDSGRVAFTVKLYTTAYPHRQHLEQQTRAALAAVDGLEHVDISFVAEIPHDGRNRSVARYPIKNAIAVASGKGGVGKSTVAVNLAVVLAQSGARVGLLDADIYGPNIPTMMGVQRLPPPQQNQMTPAVAHGVKVISIGFLVDSEKPLIWRGPMLHSAIRQFVSDVHWGELDYLVIDLPPGTGDAPLSVAQTLPLTGGIIVTLPQQVSLDDARRGLEMFRQLDVPILGVVENMSYLELPDGSRMDVFGSGGGQRLASQARVPFIGAIPMDAAVRQGGDSGEPVTIALPDSPVAQALRQIGQDIAVQVSLATIQGGQNVIPISMIG